MNRETRSAPLFVDPYNDFLSDGGKFRPRVAGVANEVNLHDHLRKITGQNGITGTDLDSRLKQQSIAG